MNHLLPQSNDFYACTARLRNSSEFKTVMGFLSQRLDAMKDQLVSAAPADYAVIQGRARELTDLINQLTKTTKDTTP